jgi:hypothetical protein
LLVVYQQIPILYQQQPQEAEGRPPLLEVDSMVMEEVRADLQVRLAQVVEVALADTLGMAVLAVRELMVQQEVAAVEAVVVLAILAEPEVVV